MATNSNAVRAGAFIVIAAMVSLGVVVVVSGPERFAAKNEFIAMFPLDADIQGMRAGDDVRLGGARVGSVKEVEVMDEQTPPVIKMVVTIPQRYKVKEGATVSLNGGLVGGAVLNIDSLGSGALLPSGGKLIGRPSALSQFFALAPKIDATVNDVRTQTLPQINRAIDEYRSLATEAKEKQLPQVARIADKAIEVLEHAKSKIDPIVDAYFGVTKSGKDAMQNVADLVGPGGKGELLATAKDIKGATEKLPEITERVKKVLDQVSTRIDSLQATTADLQETMANLKDVSGQARSILVDNRTRIDRIVAAIEGTTNNAKAFTAEVLRRPSRLIWKDDAKTQDNLNVYFTAREFAEGAQELNAAAGSLRDAVRDPRISDEEIKKRIDALNSSFEKFGKVEDKLYKSVKE